MARRSTFEADAESVQGNEGATVTFQAITMDGFREYQSSPTTEQELLVKHVVTWSGIVDDDDHALPSPADEPDVLGGLYIAEKNALLRLLLSGAPAIPAKN